MPIPDLPEPPAYQLEDKRLHSLVGAGSRFGTGSLLPRSWDPVARIVAPVAAGVAKEAIDGSFLAPKGNRDAKDIAATALGGLLAYRHPKRDLTIVPTISDDYVALDAILRW